MRYLILLISFCFIGSVNGQNIDKGLIAHYLFNGDVKDNSVNKNNGTMNGGLQFDTDRFGSKCGALKFNGKDGYVTVPNSRSLKSPQKELSIGVWFRLDKGAGGIKWLTVVCKADIRDELPQSPQYRLQATNQTISINTEFTERYVKDVAFDVWHHYTVVYDGSMVKSYLDGTKFFEFVYSNSLVPNSMPLEIGRDLPGGLEYFAGSFDELRIYNRALSDREVAAIFTNQTEKNSPKPCTPPPIPPVQPTPLPTPVPPITPPVVKNPPLVKIQTPSSTPYDTQNQVEDIVAKIENINTKKEITFEVNNQIITDFKFNVKRQLFTAQIALKPGFNVCEITATNRDGTAKDKVMLQYKPVVIKNPPIIVVEKPNTNPYSVNKNSQKIIAKIKHIQDKKEIVFKLNGQVNNSFIFDAGTGQFLSVANLELGNNFFEIIATNQDGTATETGIINYKVVANPPVVTIQIPRVNPHTSNKELQKIRAKIDNVTSKNDVKFLFNAEEIRTFTFNARRGIFEAEVQLEEGFNIFEIIATNQDGKDSASGRIRYKAPSVIPPPLPPPPTTTAPVPVPEVITPPDLGQVKVKKEFKLKAKQIELVCFDHDKSDGDIVSILVNGKVVVDKQTIEVRNKREIRVKLTLEPNKEYIVASKAWNLGEFPPNTMTMEIYGPNNKFLKKIELESEIGISEAVKLIYVPSN